MKDPLKAHSEYLARDRKSLKDRALELKIFAQIYDLEVTLDGIAPTPLRHRLSELLVQMRAEIWAFDQANSPWR